MTIGRTVIYTGRTEETINPWLLKAVDDFFEGSTIGEAADRNGIKYGALTKELHDFRKCHCKKCDPEHICSAGKKGSNRVVYCSALIDTNFKDKECPFYRNAFQIREDQ